MDQAAHMYRSPLKIPIVELARQVMGRAVAFWRRCRYRMYMRRHNRVLPWARRLLRVYQ
jgi:hypothetical protein